MKINKFLITLIIMVNPIIMVSQSQLQAFDNTLLVKYQGKADSVFLDIKGGKKIKLSETENKINEIKKITNIRNFYNGFSKRSWVTFSHGKFEMFLINCHSI